MPLRNARNVQSPRPLLEAVERFARRVSRTFVPLAVFGLLVLVIAGGIGHSLGLPKLFRDDPDLRARPFLDGWIRNSPALWGHAAMTVLLLVIWDGIDVSERLVNHLRHPDVDPGARTLGQRGEFILRNGAPFFVALLIAAALPKASAGYLAVVVELAEALAGMLAGAAVAIVAILLVEWLRKMLTAKLGERRAALRFARMLRWFAMPSGSVEVRTRIIDDFWVFLTSLFVLWAVVVTYQVIVPAVAIVSLAVLAVAAYFLVLYVRPALRVPLLAGYLLALGLTASDPYRNRFPGFGAAGPGTYAQPVHLSDGPAGHTAIDPVVALDNWKEPRRKLVVVAVSGGAYRSGFWTAKVLDALVRESARDPALADLPRSIRLLTGASGGMVASAYFAALAPAPRPDGSSAGWPSVEQALLDDIYADRGAETGGKFKTRFPVQGDGLGPVAQQMVQRDIVRYLFAPFLRPVRADDWDRWSDRGAVLEEQWRRLRPTFAELAVGELAGFRPSIILSPMMIESGQPLLISNLDLHELVVQHHAVEFFSLFPNALSSLRLQTAVRMNASFPYVSPAVALPTEPPRRVVDAGYYDNYGVGVAASYLALPGVLKWIAANTSGILVIQVRAYASKKAEAAPSPTGLAVAAEFLTSPVSAVFGARESSMVFRNAEQLDMLGRLYATKDFVQTCVFENGTSAESVEMSWYMQKAERQALDAELASSTNRAAFECVKNAWIGKEPSKQSPLRQ